VLTFVMSGRLAGESLGAQLRGFCNRQRCKYVR
jgi:hypothetical protein